jgi:hypothetical protein
MLGIAEAISETDSGALNAPNANVLAMQIEEMLETYADSGCHDTTLWCRGGIPRVSARNLYTQNPWTPSRSN